MDRACHILELDKILEMLAGECGCADAADAARALKPSPYIGQVTRLLDETDDACRLMAGFGAPSFGGLRPVTNALRRAEAGGVLSLRELLDIAQVLRAVRGLTDWRSHCENVETCLDERFAILAPNRYLEDRINTVILNEETLADNASPALADIRRKMRAMSQRVRERLDNMIHSPTYQKFLQDPIITIRDGRFVVPVKQEHRADVPGLIHDTSSSGATVFVEPMGAVEANNELRVLESKEEAEIERILRELSAEAGGFAGAIIADYDVAVQLNLIFAKARLAYKMKAQRPKLTDRHRLVLRGARHPLLDAKKAVPISVSLGVDFDTLVITGPNTGGKTVTLKTLGLLSVMVMCGLLPPVDDGSEFSVFDRVLVDLGDEQSIEQSLSTFSAHMTNIVQILKAADDSSLVLLDELGAGTDPVEGAALATAILERLREQGARIAATTHYAELKAYAIRTDGVENGSCEFDVATLRPTYRLLVGVPGRSNAFAISEKLGIDPSLVARAQSLVTGEQQKLESVVVRLEEQRQQMERELREAQAHAQQAKAAGDEAERKLTDATQQQQQVLDRAQEEARRLVDRARSQAQAILDELTELRRQKNAADFSDRVQAAKSGVNSRLDKLEQQIDPVTHRPKTGGTPPRALKPGDEVLIIDIDKKATVLTAADKGGQVEVQAGIIRTRVPLTNLRLLGGQKAETPKPKRGSGDRELRTASAELDLRGMMTDEAELMLDRFLDDAVMGKLTQVTIIHGKGTGALRAMVQKYLRRHHAVANFRLGTYGEGEDGVTIVELK